MKIAIVATGDEVVNGDVLNTNSQIIAQGLQAEGFTPDIHVACCDSLEQIQASIEWVLRDHDMVILTGGLGPTTDDKTRFALANLTGETLVEYPEVLHHIEARLKRVKIEMTDGNRQQALFPPNTLLFTNPYGSAFGGCFSANNKQFVMLPGPPRECIPMFNDYVLPLLRKLKPTDQSLLRWRVFGIPESVLGEMMEKAVAGLDCQTGYRWDPPYVEFKIRCDKAAAVGIQRLIDPLLAPYMIASVEQKASERLQEVLRLKQPTMLIDDQTTGGTLQALIQKPENYHFLSFYPSKETPLWLVEIRGLEEYWTQTSHPAKLSVHLLVKKQGKLVLEETYELPYFSTLILQYAAEWVSYKLADCLALIE